MKMIQVYDPPMCCSTGVCGPDVGSEAGPVPPLTEMGLAEQGVPVERFHLAQTPNASPRRRLVRAALTEKGEAACPWSWWTGRWRSALVSEPRGTGRLGRVDGEPGSLFTAAVAELVAIGAAIRGQCETLFALSHRGAGKLGSPVGDWRELWKWPPKVKRRAAPEHHATRARLNADRARSGRGHPRGLL